MAIEQALITWVHLVASAIWVGGSIFLGVILSPIVRQVTPSMEERLRLMILVGKRFNKIAIPSLIILVVTGVYNSRVLLVNYTLLDDSSYGVFLVVKMILVVVLVVVYLTHVRIIRQDVVDRIMSKSMGEPELRRLRIKIIVLGEVTVVLSVAILFFAALLDSGV
ncbi:MAG: copper-binding protein [Cenarchaeum sp. SB0665_bin_23]|nr:copper-binding protein [Cenarchaeum sp. SB0667_bin_13]MXY37679.1 copper-binding protein [Cenarchaeum sp. SB0664_bin_35]MXY60894.1 copper-binding protein [Cenarchaeum sp. SB0665_bin_23]MXZ93148.1 copper-binding protein [Cenarchaeum sp. SB0666_bin_15]MYB46937.1 copper-binding protein [Cenarchaeum sp. SB0662_bin_33]MYC80444.1 copper-binding protein [Cenarchaeum sp. SB0661_bin_35]MYD59127.1 copper-binding protein [Cenarchaeum sp. SB0678_bin_8]MYG32893.1 copper-binding protein [Cenarchaeum sp.